MSTVLSWDLQKLLRLHARDIARALRRRGLDEGMAAEPTKAALAGPPQRGRSVFEARSSKECRFVDINRQSFNLCVDPK